MGGDNSSHLRAMDFPSPLVKGSRKETMLCTLNDMRSLAGVESLGVVSEQFVDIRSTRFTKIGRP